MVTWVKIFYQPYKQAVDAAGHYTVLHAVANFQMQISRVKTQVKGQKKHVLI